MVIFRNFIYIIIVYWSIKKLAIKRITFSKALKFKYFFNNFNMVSKD